MVSLGTVHDNETFSPLRVACKSPTRRGSSNSGGNGTPGFAHEIRKTRARNTGKARPQWHTCFIEKLRAYHDKARSSDQLFHSFAKHSRMMIHIFLARYGRH